LRFYSIHKLNDSKPIGDAFSPARRFELKRATGQAFEPIARARLRSSGALSPHWNTPFHPQILLQTLNWILDLSLQEIEAQIQFCRFGRNWQRWRSLHFRRFAGTAPGQ
jgi:hypothetical protein